MPLHAAVSTLAYATLHPLQATKAALAALVSPVHTGAVKQCVELLSCVSVNGLQLLAVCPTLLGLLGTQQMEQVALQAMALLQCTHHVLQCSECCFAWQSLSLLSTPACSALLQQTSEFVVAALRLCQTEHYSAANKQLAHVLQALLRQLSATTPTDDDNIRPTSCANTSSAQPATSSAEWSEWMAMLLGYHQLYQTQQLCPSEWLYARSMLLTRDERAMALWQRWKGRLSHSTQRSVREESQRYWLADDDGDVREAEEAAADADDAQYVVELRALLAEVQQEEARRTFV